MKNCLDEGTLRAYLDDELAGSQAGRAAGHVENCADCGVRAERMRTAIRRVDELLDALAPEDLAAIGRTRPDWRWVAGGVLAAALAAVIVLIFAASWALHVPPPAVTQAAAIAPPQPVFQNVVSRAAHVRHHHQRPERGMDEFVPLAGADPMQVGMVVRVVLPGVREIAADLVIGEDGRARAIRFTE